MTTPDVLVGIRSRRLGGAGRGAATVAAEAMPQPEMVYQDLEEARALMRKLGCIVINRTIRP